MGKIKKILEKELTGGTQNTDIYPVTSTKAVYDENNERLDNILKSLGDKIYSSIADRAVSSDNITFMEKGNNLFDKFNLKSGYYYISGNKIIYDTNNQNYYSTYKIPCKPNITYVLDCKYISIRKVNCLDKDGFSVLAAENVIEFTTPDTCVCFILAIEKEKSEYVKIVESGNETGKYEEHAYLPTKLIKDKSITVDKIADEAVTTEKIVKGAVTAEKMFPKMWLHSDNLWDDFIVSHGYYVNDIGLLAPNPSYNASYFIEVSANTAYVFGNNGTPITPRFVNEYDANKQHIGRFDQPKNYTTSETCAFIRVTVLSIYEKIQVYKDSLPSSYIQATYINPLCFLTEENSGQPIYFHLPTNIYVPAGLIVEMYYKQMLLNADDFYISTTGVGSNLNRKLQLIGSEDKIGTYTLNVQCFDKNENIVASGTSNVHVVTSNIPRAIKVLPIGDSITNNKPWLDRLSTLSPNISTVGTRKGKHEGRSGVTCTFYNRGTLSYDYDVSYTGTGSDAAEFSSSTQYHIGDFCKYTVNLKVGGTNKEVSCVFMFIAEHLGAWDKSKVVNMTTRNPFWNPFTDSFSINWYKQIQNINPDIICIWLGTNGLNLTPETNENGALGIKTLVDNIRKEDTNTPIIIVNTLFRCSQNGIGTQGNTDGYSSTSEYKHNADKKILLLEKAVYELLKSYNNVYICPVAATFDSEYNYLNPETCKVQVNPYFTNTDTVFELMESDSVHPLNYNQCADQIFGTISSIVNNQ